MKNKPLGFWRALEAVPGLAAVDAEWKAKFGPEYDQAKAFLRPNSKPASSYPCIISRGCGCDHDVVIHDSEDIVAVCHCERGCDDIRLTRSDIVVYEVDRLAIGNALVSAFGLFKETDTATGLHGTTLLGFYSPSAGLRFPVYLTIQLEADNFGYIADGLLARLRKPFILLAPTRALCPAKVEKRLLDRGSSFIPLSENAVISEKRKFRLLRPIEDIMSQFILDNSPIHQINCEPTSCPDPLTTSGVHFRDEIVLERKEVGEEIHWIVNGVDRGRLFTRSTAKKAKILEILFDQIGQGWIPHRTFMNSCGWSEEEYFPSSGNPGCMQRHLSDLRVSLGLRIEFSKDKGVRFTDNVVKSRKVSRKSF